MSIKTTIADGEGVNGEAAVVAKSNKPAGVMVYTHPQQDIIGQTKAALNATYGADMNQNVAFSGTPDGVHDGTDSVLWTGSALTGTWDFASTTQAQAGTKSIEAINTVNNDEAQLERGSTISTGSYVALTGYIYLTSWSGAGTKEVELRLRLAGVDVGINIDISTYIDTGTLGSWQKFSIPMGDFGVGANTIDQVIVKTIDIGGGAAPDYYLDEIQFEETGSATFTIEPDVGSIYSISTLKITMADAYVSTLADATHQKLPYNTLLGVSALTNGINFKLTTGGVVRFNGNFRQHIDFMSFPGLNVESGGDGTNAWASYEVEFDPPFVMNSATNDKFEMTASDDLSGFLFLRIFARGGKEELK